MGLHAMLAVHLFCLNTVVVVAGSMEKGPHAGGRGAFHALWIIGIRNNY